MVKTVKVPPDGGYGWVIVLACSLSNFINIPMMQNFGLIFKDTFAEMGLSATEGSLIINMNAAFGMIMGLLNGFLLKVFGYRKIAIFAALLISIGIVMTAFAKTFTHFIIAYGLITSLGFGMNMAAYGLAINCFFLKKKNKAVGYNMTIMGLGPIVMPQLINFLMRKYDVQGVTLILGAICANSLVAAFLLRPVKWYMKTQVVPEEDEKSNETIMAPDEKNDIKITVTRGVSKEETRRKNSIMNSRESLNEIENSPIYGLDSAFNGSMMSLHSMQRRASVVSQTRRRESLHSLQKNQKDLVYPELSKPIKKKSFWRDISQRFINFFDLDLLKDPIYVNILFGISIAIFAEINFSLLTAFILAEFGLQTDQIATFMSILGIADIIFRFLAPYVGDFLKWPPRQMYMMTLFLLMITRFSLLISTNYFILLGVALGLGMAKGIRTVYMSLVIPTYVPIEKLASASGLQMMINGLCIMAGGPIIGYIRDVTGDYDWCIVILNCITFTTVLMWSIEHIVVRSLRKKGSSKINPAEQTDALLGKYKSNCKEDDDDGIPPPPPSPYHLPSLTDPDEVPKPEITNDLLTNIKLKKTTAESCDVRTD